MSQYNYNGVGQGVCVCGLCGVLLYSVVCCVFICVYICVCICTCACSHTIQYHHLTGCQTKPSPPPIVAIGSVDVDAAIGFGLQSYST